MSLKMGTDEANTGRENLLRVFRVSTVTTTRMDRTAARISQGCRNCCQYCARPLIRTGPLSRTVSVATARLKMAEPAEPSHLEPSRAENRLMTKTGSARAHEPAELGLVLPRLGSKWLS